jgi:hypothetical protein
MNRKQILIAVGGLMLALVSGQAQEKTAPAKQPAAPAPASASANKSFSGKVVETMDAAGYTYVQVDTGKEKLWAAGPKIVVKVGDKVSITEGMPMPDYHSKSLKRDFPMIYFTGSIEGGAAPAPGGTEVKLPDGHPPLVSSPPAKLPEGHPAVGGGVVTMLPEGHPALTNGAAKAKIDLTGIKKAKGGYTIKEIFAGQSKLKGKEISVRGKVVKFNSMIMGKNWLHIQDGTGAPGSNDLTITTSTTAKLGDTVLATGILSADKDFGSGYKYSTIMEDAKVVVE